MNVGELQLALLPYHQSRQVIVVFSPQEDRDYTIESIDEITDTEHGGRRYVIIACKEEYPE